MDNKDLYPKMIILGLVFFVTVITLLMASGCASTAPNKEYVYVDIETYKKWGMKNLVPIGTREIPSETEICNNPMWADSEGCKEWKREKNR